MELNYLLDVKQVWCRAILDWLSLFKHTVNMHINVHVL